MITRCGVLGSPIAHSLSPVLHRAAYAELGLADWHYDAHRVEETELAGFVAALGPQWRGLSLTKPLKFAALDLGEPDAAVRLAGAANTLVLEPDGWRRLYNTDIGGLSAALRAAGVDTLEHVVVLGAGGTTRAALVSVRDLGASSVVVLARRVEQIESLTGLAAELGLELHGRDWSQPVPGGDLLISTVGTAAIADRADQAVTQAAAVFDVIYDPWPTPLAQAAARQGRVVVNGLDLLVHQAVEQVQLMTGRSVSAELLLSAGRKALREAKPA